MTEQETKVLLGVLHTAFPRFYANIRPESDELNAAVALWHMMLKDTPADVAGAALYKLIATCDFPPSIAEVRKAIASINQPHIPYEDEAWGEVLLAIRSFGYMRQEEAMVSMSEPVRQVVERMGWRELCLSENSVADRAHFIKLYGTMLKREQDKRQIPAQVRGMIEQLSESLGVNQNEKAVSVLHTRVHS